MMQQLCCGLLVLPLISWCAHDMFQEPYAAIFRHMYCVGCFASHVSLSST
jgi:hypothetical protein